MVCKKDALIFKQIDQSSWSDKIFYLPLQQAASITWFSATKKWFMLTSSLKLFALLAFL